MTSPLRLGIAGLGTVGAGTLQVLQQRADLLAERCGRALQVTAVCARDRARDRGVDLGSLRWHDDAVALAKDSEIDVFVELIGGSEGIAKEAVEAALSSGKDVVTANKALLAHHGAALARLAEQNGAVVAYEAAVAGGIPAIKSLREGLAGNSIGCVYGILNGTCNYILSSMRETGRTFEEVLEEAQALGYAEADPSFDVDGIDTANKLVIIANAVLGAAATLRDVSVEGIRGVTEAALRAAADENCAINLRGDESGPQDAFSTPTSLSTISGASGESTTTKEASTEGRSGNLPRRSCVARFALWSSQLDVTALRVFRSG